MRCFYCILRKICNSFRDSWVHWWFFFSILQSRGFLNFDLVDDYFYLFQYEMRYRTKIWHTYGVTLSSPQKNLQFILILVNSVVNFCYDLKKLTFLRFWLSGYFFFINLKWSEISNWNSVYVWRYLKITSYEIWNPFRQFCVAWWIFFSVLRSRNW